MCAGYHNETRRKLVIGSHKISGFKAGAEQQANQGLRCRRRQTKTGLGPSLTIKDIKDFFHHLPEEVNIRSLIWGDPWDTPATVLGFLLTVQFVLFPVLNSCQWRRWKERMLARAPYHPLMHSWYQQIQAWPSGGATSVVAPCSRLGAGLGASPSSPPPPSIP